MSKRPLIYEIISGDGSLYYDSKDKYEALRECRRHMINHPLEEITFAITQNGKKIRVLASYSGQDLIELIEDELDD